MAAPQRRTLFLLDGSMLSDSAASNSSPWMPTHHLDSVPRLLECNVQLLAHLPADSRVLVFVSQDGFNLLRSTIESEAESGGLSLEPASVQCVPSGCKVVDFILELGRKKAREGCQVTIISNTPEVVCGCDEAALSNLSHLGFMFVDGELVMPGLSALAAVGQRQAEEAVPQAELTKRCSSRSRSRTPPRRAKTTEDTLRDSQLDGESLAEEVQDTLVDGAGSAQAGLAALEGLTREEEDAFAYADTQVLEEFSLPREASGAGGSQESKVSWGGGAASLDSEIADTQEIPCTETSMENSRAASFAADSAAGESELAV